MRTIIYTLSNGTVVNNLAQAKASGLSYTISCRPVIEKVHVTEAQKAKRVKIK